jgi:hypothetical protein
MSGAGPQSADERVVRLPKERRLAGASVVKAGEIGDRAG